MAYLSIPCRVLYEPKNDTTGWMGIYAFVLKPDLTVEGPFPMVEAPGVFSGRYYMDYLTTLKYPPGEYFFLISSPQENLTTTLRVPIYVPPPGVGPVGEVDENLVVGKLAPSPTIVGQFENDDRDGVVVEQSVSAIVENTETTGRVENSNLEGTIYELP